MDRESRTVIVGAGQAASQTAVSLRQYGFEGSITIIGDEDTYPYQRPPLSKAYMKGELDKERLYIRPADWYSSNNVDLRLSCSVVSVDREAKTVEVNTGDTLSYDRLVFATGSRARKVSVEGADLENIFELRTLDDVERIRPTLAKGKKIAIVGAGYIGLEAAAVARQLGLDVTVIEMTNRVLARVTSPVMSSFYQRIHEAEGVTILTEAALASFVGDAGKVTKAILQDGREIDADIVLVGIGILPNQELAAEAGIDCKDGIVVDCDGRTSDPTVFAGGDCARRPLVHYEGEARLESVHNAIEQGKIIAASIMGKPRPKEEAPWFWSDQYDLKLQIAGLSSGFDTYILRGDEAEKSFAVFYFKADQLIAVDAVNAPGDFLFAKRWIANSQTPDLTLLKDKALTIKEIAQQM